MLSKENRLRKREDFDNILKNGKPTTGRFIFLKFLKNNLGVSRFCFVVNLKISKKSTIRNKIKRQLKDIIRNNLNNIKSGFDVAIIAKSEIVNNKYKKIKEEVESLIEKTKLYK